jgi:hypothetical protein
VGLVTDVDEINYLAGMRDGEWLDRQDFPPLRYAVPGVIPEGQSLLIGPPKIGKSWFVLDCGLAVSAGGTAWGGLKVGEPRSVFYLALEDGDRRMQDRCRKLLGEQAIPRRFTYMTNLHQPGTVIPTIEAWLDIPRPDEPAPVVILDTLGKVMPPAMPGESAYQRDYRVGSRLKRLVDDRPGTALIINHHDRKAGSEDFVETVSGTHGLAGSADTILALVRPRNEADGLHKVTGRDVPEGEYALTFVGGCAWIITDGDLHRAAERAIAVRATARLSDRSTDVYDYVCAASAPVTPAEVERELDLPDARRYLARLVESGRLVRAARGLYTRVPTVPLHNQEPLTRDIGTVGTHIQEAAS